MIFHLLSGLCVHMSGRRCECSVTYSQTIAPYPLGARVQHSDIISQLLRKPPLIQPQFKIQPLSPQSKPPRPSTQSLVPPAVLPPRLLAPASSNKPLPSATDISPAKSVAISALKSPLVGSTAPVAPPGGGALRPLLQMPRLPAPPTTFVELQQRVAAMAATVACGENTKGESTGISISPSSGKREIYRSMAREQNKIFR